jgi:cytosine/adenosine deaminase-related metal-dependent hydrolase/ubiquinone/menaquinone biosynthesis C-methylase UbiE
VSSSSRLKLGVQEGYARWAKNYTAQPNPMFALEERVLKSLLPELRGKDIVDLGCGTGRWLQTLSTYSPSSLVGVDASPHMLEEAERRNLAGVQILRRDCLETRLPSASADVILNSFVLSHITRPEAFARELLRLGRPGCNIFITDLHPDTARRLDWKRAFSSDGDHIEIDSTFRPVAELIDVFQSAGLQVKAVLEPPIGEPERWIFEYFHREDLYPAANSNPSIIIFQLQVPRGSPPVHASTVPLAITNARVALDEREAISTSVHLSNERVAFLGTTVQPAVDTLDLSGFLLLPGLVNAHDHLDFALFPRLGRGEYQNAIQWAHDIYKPESSPIRGQLEIPKATRLWWGALRNLLCGVTTVCHHNPPAECLDDPDFPIRVVPNCVWAHSLPFDAEIQSKLQQTSDQELFVIHAAEGIDESSRSEFARLKAMGALRSGTILVHGLALDAADLPALVDNGVGLVWCPSSNMFLFGRTLDPHHLRNMELTALGSDSPLTGTGDLLDEIRLAWALGAFPSEIYRLVTQRPSRMLRLPVGTGSLHPDSPAELIAVRDVEGAPADRLCTLTINDIELVIVAGKIRVASAEVMEKLPPHLRLGLQPLRTGDTVRWISAPVDHLMRDATRSLGADVRLSHRPLRLDVAGL